MPTSRPGKFTVIRTNGLAQRFPPSPTENEPIFQYRLPSRKPERGAHFAKIQTTTNSQYAIQTIGVNSGSGHADHPGATTAIPFLFSPDPRKRTHFSSPVCHAGVRGAARKNTQQSNLQSWRQGSWRTGPTAKSHVTRGGWVYTWLNPGGVE